MWTLSAATPVKGAPLTVIALRLRSSLVLYILAALLGTFAKMSPRTMVPFWGVLLWKLKAVPGGLLGAGVKMLPAALASPVPAPVIVSSAGLYVNVNVTSVTPAAL